MYTYSNNSIYNSEKKIHTSIYTNIQCSYELSFNLSCFNHNFFKDLYQRLLTRKQHKT